MQLRKLEEKDACYMLEWMKDEKVNRFFQFDPDTITEESVKSFIASSLTVSNNYHFAIADDSDIYLGTVSLKNINHSAKNAEYAIALRRSAQGIGAGKFATHSILGFAFETLKLERVYLNVLSFNEPAIAFYLKLGFVYEGEFYNHIYVKEHFQSLKWFRMMKDEYKSLNNKLYFK